MRKDKVYNYINNAMGPVREEEIISTLADGVQEIKKINSILNEFIYTGRIIRTKQHSYGIPEKMGLIFGTLTTNERGFGFVKNGSVSDSDIFIPATMLNGAMNGDTVFVKLLESRKNNFKSKREGEVVKVVERHNSTVVGTIQKSRNMGFVIPDDKRILKDIYVPKSELSDVKDGQKVVVEITKWPERNRSPEGKIKEILGFIDESGVDILSVIRKYKLPEGFNKKVLAEADKLPDEPSESEMKGRVDYRDKKLITIDGIDAKDLDDAVYLEKTSDGNYKLSVHIADVSHYVKRGSKLDKEALKRGTSVYLINKVIPMLPHKLSNGICSLNENVNRLTMSVEMVIDKKGKILEHEIVESVIKTRHRLNYKEVTELLEGGKTDESIHIDIEVQKMLFDMAELAMILREKRRARGAVSFDFPEAYIILDDEGVPTEIVERERGVSNKIIEEFMLVANETVAEHMYWLEIPFVYRIHENPDAERIRDLNAYIRAFGKNIRIKDDEVHPRELQKLINEIDGEGYERLVNKMMLRSLKQAKYSPNCVGHFGLAAKYYSHFTSPIRRYPDLEIHRIIKDYLHGKIDMDNLDHLEDEVFEVSEKSSSRERIAESAEREVDDMKKCEYMLTEIGSKFTGVISGVTKNGIYTELDNTIEGYTKVSMLGHDYYRFDEKTLSFIGEKTRAAFSIGDIVKIRVESVDVEKREIRFTILKNTGKKERNKRSE